MIFDRSTYMGVHTGPHLSIPLPPWLNLHKPCAGGNHLIANVTFPAPHFCSNPLRCLFHPCLKTFKLLSLQPGKQHSYILLQMCLLLEDFIITFFFPIAHIIVASMIHQTSLPDFGEATESNWCHILQKDWQQGENLRKLQVQPFFSESIAVDPSWIGRGLGNHLQLCRAA